MKTLEMMNEAQKTNKIYTCGKDKIADTGYSVLNIRYSSELGFHDTKGRKWRGQSFYYIDNLFDINNWRPLDNQK